MYYAVLDNQLDIAALALLVFGAAWLMRAGVARRGALQLPTVSLFATASVAVIAAVCCATYAGDAERSRLRSMLQGIAPTYAWEIAFHDHERITAQTKPDDPTYLAIIASQIGWLKCNSSVADIYTFARLDTGRYVLLVGSETDYDRHG